MERGAHQIHGLPRITDWLILPSFLTITYPRNTVDVEKTPLYNYSIVLNVQFTSSKLNGDNRRIFYSSSICGLLGMWMILENPFTVFQDDSSHDFCLQPLTAHNMF